MVFKEENLPMRQVLRDIDVVQKPPVALKPEVREILLLIERIENSGRKPAFSEITKEIMLEAADEVSKQPKVKPCEAVTRFGTKLVLIEEVEGKLKISVDNERLRKELVGLAKAGYLAVEGEKDEGDKRVYALSMECKDQMDKFKKMPELV